MKSSFPRLLCLFVTGLILIVPRAFAQAETDDDPPSAAAATAAATKGRIPPDINGNKTIVPPPAKTKPFRLAIYKDLGSGAGGVVNVSDRARQVPGATITILSGEQIAAGALTNDKFDAVAFTGGSGSKQAQGIGETGRANVKKFVENGGGYLGICAGAYLATSGYSWSLGIINAKTISSKWKRGQGFLDLEVTPDGAPIVGDVKGSFKCRYANGPVVKPAGVSELPEYKVAAWFRSELALNGTPAGIQVDSPAAFYSTYGKGRVFILSPHPENTPGLENFVPRALLWIAAK